MPIIQSNVEQAVRMCLNQVDTCTVPGKPVLEDTLNTCLDSTVQMLRCSALRIDLTQEEIEEFTRQVREVIGIHQNDGHMIQESSPITYWFSDYLDRDYYFTNNPDANKENWISIEKSRTFYWNRYRKYLLDSGDFPLPVVNKLDKGTLLDLMNALGDPNSTESFFRKGLVVGDVQSGKTATYTGLVCKAADAGYKAIVILTGTIEDLRAQTQQRMEEGFIGIDIQAQMERRINDVRVGVGQRKYDFDIRYRPNDIHSFTSRKNDFKQPNGVERIGPGKIFFFVIKKQRDVLDNLYSWLSLNVNEQNHKIPYSLLLIDDEADNASINTLKEGQTRQNNVNNEVEDATSINYRIRKLADLFDKTTYVGFTATPFANVFIQPENDDDMAHVDLFPSDFIYSLEAPDNYIGAKRIFITHNDNDEEIIPEYYSSLTPITDAGNTVGDGWPFYYKHRIDWDGEVPDSLTDSILCFYLANAIRNYRGDTTCASTMMINMSRFANVQKRIRDKIAPVITDISNSIEYNLNINCPDDYTDPMLVRLKEIWNEQYEENRNTGARQRRATEKNPKRGNHDTLEWKDIVPHLRDANKNIEIRTINNQSTEKLNYDRYERENKRGLRVIAIGGLTLSRGLTLKNLVVTYFYRNTSTYDVLMQMGRWFGYRRNYEDIFRIWMGTQSIGWYGEIADAAEELKDAIRRMQEHELRPIDYGMRVRKVSSELQITAANKMRTAQTIVEWVNFTGTIIDTPSLVSQ